jgi:hypothetical protein
VLLTSVVVIVAAAVLYPLASGIREVQADRTITSAIENPRGAPEWWLGRVPFESLYFSVVTFTTLGDGDVRPLGAWARFLAGVEALLRALLAALLGAQLVFVLARIVTW